MNCVILDGFAATGNDLDFQPIRDLCQRVTVYQRTPPEEIIRRIGNAQRCSPISASLTGK